MDQSPATEDTQHTTNGETKKAQEAPRVKKKKGTKTTGYLPTQEKANGEAKKPHQKKPDKTPKKPILKQPAQKLANQADKEKLKQDEKSKQALSGLATQTETKKHAQTNSSQTRTPRNQE
ncbi:hypothetical protein SAMN04487969_104176 [Paenibacillus algorifonticola]|uniref:Uncharacterized protein n=2 Tax=Paenibacillus algorifonticola TaxID=684063 RepID=A0A1I2BZH4_9BACL|nr:hypothetical protein SAMN04487969_104176 [Paenibacillus algorifonticola]